MKAVKSIRLAALLLVCTLLAGACQRRPFSSRNTGVNLVLKINTRIVNQVDVALPANMRVGMYNPDNHSLSYADFVGPEGGYISPEPGTYDILVYNFETESTILRGEDDFLKAEAYTNEISPYLKGQIKPLLEQRRKLRQERLAASSVSETAATDDEERVVYEPDHLFVGRVKGQDIPRLLLEEGDREIVIEVDATSIVETWKIEIKGVQGAEYISSISAIISGQAASTYLYSGEDSDESVSVYFTMQTNRARTSDEGMIMGSFNTFGKKPGVESKLSLDVSITDSGGNTYDIHYDITSDFQDNPERVIVIEDDIKIDPPSSGGGGFDPSVEDWDNVRTDIEL
ncbi:MAG: DUF5119 domain-containing protein [Candidatus Cryptobacteroides sp.]